MLQLLTRPQSLEITIVTVMNNPFTQKREQSQTSTLFHPPANDPNELTHSDDSVDLGLEIDSGIDPKNNPDNENPTENGNAFNRAQKGALTQAKKPKPLINVLM